MITLVSLGGAPVREWTHGAVHVVEATPSAIASLWPALRGAASTNAVLFWDRALGAAPAAETLERLLGSGCDVMHAGLALGLTALPRALQYAHPSWMLGAVQSSDRACSSFRVTLRSCLVRQQVLDVMDGPSAAFDSLDGAALEMGHRWLSGGVLLRFEPSLVTSRAAESVASLPLDDELRFARVRYGRTWGRYAAFRAWRTGLGSLPEAMRSWSRIASQRSESVVRVMPRAPLPPLETSNASETVTVLIPTIERPAYLRTTLEHLRHQTHRPHQVIVVDQTPIESRDMSYVEEFSDLPLVSIVLEQAGQCSSRNAGLARATGKWVLFIDDDVDLPPDTIARHLAVCARHGADSCSGVAEEDGVPRLPLSQQFVQISSVFNGNNTLARRSALIDAGGFDLAYDRGIRADGDLGQRLHNAGRLLLLDGANSVFHHHAPRGGLRVHKARVVTRATSKLSITGRHLLTPSEVYMTLRHFGERALRELLWIRAMSSLTMSGSAASRMMRGAVALLRMPGTLRHQALAVDAGRSLLTRYPQFAAMPFTEPASGMMHGTLAGKMNVSASAALFRAVTASPEPGR